MNKTTQLTCRVAFFLGSLLISQAALGQSFTKITTGDPVTDGKNSTSTVWVDYDNDGDPDIFVTNSFSQSEDLYQNNADGSFTRITGIPLTSLETNAGLTR